VLEAIRDLVPLAPLHNPGAIAGIEAVQRALPGLPQVAVFDTAFHATLPDAAATYAIDADVARKHGIRRYGFHGISHRYVAERTARLLDRSLDRLNVIVLHLGNGASAAAIHSGRSVETSMGFTPLEGLVMGTRSGDVDPAIPTYLLREAAMSAQDVTDLLEHRSGLSGLCGQPDMRSVLSARAAGDRAASLAVAVYCHRIRKYVGAYHAVLGRLDAIAFTAGVGENAAPIRAEALAGLENWGIAVDPARNESGDGGRVISPPGTPIAVCVVPTNEELAIAEEVTAVLATGSLQSAPTL
jgi:acetate kinase